MNDSFWHVETARTIVFGAAALERARDLLGDGYTLLTTPRAAASAPSVAERAGAQVDVPGGHVDSVAAALRPEVAGRRLVALGGGRVIDVAKALAAADPPREVIAIPTSLSAAEMTGVHRHAHGVPGGTPHVRPAAVINDPELSASQPVDALAASSANSLAHAIMALCSDRGTPIARAVAESALRHIAAGWSGEPDRAGISLGALMAGWSVDVNGLGFHHVLAQTVVRITAVPHARANAALLPATVRATRSRKPAELERLDRALGVALESVAEGLRNRAGANLREVTSDSGVLERAVEAAAERPEIGGIAPAPDADEVRRIYLASA